MIEQSTINNVIWKACDTFRGKIDSSVYKDYILVMLFIKYLSDSYKEHFEKFTAEYDNEEMVKRMLSRDRFILDDKTTFDYLYENRTENNIGVLINTVLEKIEENNRAKLENVFRNIDFNSELVFGNKNEKNTILRNLIEDFYTVNLRPSNLENEDIIGNSYEYLISQFASDAGKKGGEFFTPSMVSELLSRLVKPVENDRIYDPTCGSGSLLIKSFNKIQSKKARIYGQEKNGQTHALCKMNMFLHGIDDANIAWGDTIANPLHIENDSLMKFQVIVANPPFSLDKWSTGFSNNSANSKEFKMEASFDKYNRFSFGVPPSGKGDYAFVLHMINSLAKDGRMGVVLPHGVLFRGSSEEKIRQKLIENNYIDAIIGLPNNLFYGTGIPTCILLFKKNRTRNDILFINAATEGNFEKGKNQNKLREIDIQHIVDTYEKYETIDKYSYVASVEEIKENNYNLTTRHQKKVLIKNKE